MGERRVKRRYGPSGSASSDGDILTGWYPGMSPDIPQRYRQRFKVPPMRIPADQLDAETFKEMILEHEKRADKIQETRRTNAEKMTKKLFFEILNDPTAKQRRQTRTARERMLQAMEYFSKLDEDLWLEDQMRILEGFLDRKRMQARIEGYEAWARIFTVRIKKTHKQVYNYHGATKAKQFAEAAWTYIESRKPKDVQPFTKIIRRRIRQLSLRSDEEARRRFSEEIEILSSKLEKPEPEPPKKKRGRKKKEKGTLPVGKVPIPDK